MSDSGNKAFSAFDMRRALMAGSGWPFDGAPKSEPASTVDWRAEAERLRAELETAHLQIVKLENELSTLREDLRRDLAELGSKMLISGGSNG